MESIKILEVIRQGQIGGGESHLLDLVDNFNLKEITPIVLAFTSGAMIDTFIQKGIKTYVIETSNPFDIRIYKKIKTIIQNEHIQIIHAHGSRAASNVAILAKQLSIPLIYTVHGWSFHQDQNPVIYKLRVWCEKMISTLSQKVICVSLSNQHTGQTTFGLTNSTVIENGVNLKRFNPKNNFKNIREELSFSEEDFIIGFIARLTKQKAPIDFVKSVIIAHQQNPRIKALIVGDGDMREETIEHIRINKAEEYIHITPFRQDVPDLLHAIDIFCLPSLWEGLSISLLEAMAMRKALVVTPTDGTKELIHHNQNGKIASFSSPEELTKNYIDYFNNQQQIQTFGEYNQDIIQEKFDCQRVSKTVSNIYKTYINIPLT